MSKIVYHHPLPNPGDTFKYHLRVGFMSLHVAMREGMPTHWFEVNTNQTKTSEIEIICVGTGWTIENDAFWYLGTIIKDEFVWHYYARFIND